MAEELKSAVKEWLDSRAEKGPLTKEEDLPEWLQDLLWKTIADLEGHPFFTARKLAFTYEIRGFEMFVDRKDKSITRSSVMLSFRTALQMQLEGEPVSGPKKLGTFGASYLYPIFQQIGVLPKELGKGQEEEESCL